MQKAVFNNFSSVPLTIGLHNYRSMRSMINQFQKELQNGANGEKTSS